MQWMQQSSLCQCDKMDHQWFQFFAACLIFQQLLVPELLHPSQYHHQGQRGSHRCHQLLDLHSFGLHSFDLHQKVQQGLEYLHIYQQM